MKHVFANIKRRTGFRVVFAATASAVFAVVQGCGRRDPASSASPPRDTFRSQVVFDLFDALEGEDVKLALSNIDRLRRFTEESAFLDLIEERERNRRLTRGVNEFLDRREYAEALAFLDESVQRQGVSNYADQLRDQVQALQGIAEYRREFPFATPLDAQDRLTLLRRNLGELVDQSAVREWLEFQRKLVRDLRVMEREQDLAALLADIDRWTVTGDRQKAHQGISQLGERIPEHALPALRDAMAGADHEALRRVVVEHRRDLEYNRNVEIAAALCWGSFQEHPELANALYKHLRLWPSASLSGMRLRMQMAFMTGQTAQGLRQVQQLLVRLMGEGILSREQFRARPWRAPFPTVPDLLNRIAQIREFQGTKPAPTESESP